MSIAVPEIHYRSIPRFEEGESSQGNIGIMNCQQNRNGNGNGNNFNNFNNNNNNVKQGDSHEMTQDIRNPGNHDVLLGRGGGANSHSGNINFRDLVAQHKHRYFAATKIEKPNVAREVVDIWKKLKPPGRFLTRVEDGKKGSGSVKNAIWRLVDDKKATLKASQCLREKPKEAREQSTRQREEQERHIKDGVQKVKEALEKEKERALPNTPDSASSFDTMKASNAEKTQSTLEAAYSMKTRDYLKDDQVISLRRGSMPVVSQSSGTGITASSITNGIRPQDRRISLPAVSSYQMQKEIGEGRLSSLGQGTMPTQHAEYTSIEMEGSFNGNQNSHLTNQPIDHQQMLALRARMIQQARSLNTHIPMNNMGGIMANAPNGFSPNTREQLMQHQQMLAERQRRLLQEQEMLVRQEHMISKQQEILEKQRQQLLNRNVFPNPAYAMSNNTIPNTSKHVESIPFSVHSTNGASIHGEKIDSATKTKTKEELSLENDSAYAHTRKMFLEKAQDSLPSLDVQKDDTAQQNEINGVDANEWIEQQLLNDSGEVSTTRESVSKERMVNRRRSNKSVDMMSLATGTIMSGDGMSFAFSEMDQSVELENLKEIGPHEGNDKREKRSMSILSYETTLSELSDFGLEDLE